MLNNFIKLVYVIETNNINPLFNNNILYDNNYYSIIIINGLRVFIS